MRKARNLNYNLISICTNVMGIVVFSSICFATGEGLSIYREYELLDWVFLASLSLSFVLFETLMFMSLQNWAASQVQPYAFVNLVSQAILDVLVFAAKFTPLQILGISIIILVYLAEIFYKGMAISCSSSNPDDDDNFKAVAESDQTKEDTFKIDENDSLKGIK